MAFTAGTRAINQKGSVPVVIDWDGAFLYLYPKGIGLTFLYLIVVRGFSSSSERGFSPSSERGVSPSSERGISQN